MTSHTTRFQPQCILITGGAGFIGSNFVRFLADTASGISLVVLDALTYAGNKENLADIEDRFAFVHGDICDERLVHGLFDEYHFDTIVNFAAETHVDRSILGPMVFTQTNVLGTHTLLDAAVRNGVGRFIQISTDEVYGSLGAEGYFTEGSPIAPTSPYAASKAAADLIVQSYFKTFGIPAIITRCSNNYGPYQFPEKLIPLMITNALRDIKLPVYGDGMNVRDWIHTLDHARAVYAILLSGEPGSVYNIGSSNEWANIDIVRSILKMLGKPESLIEYVKDRPAHDRRYAIDAGKIRTELQWSPSISFEDGLAQTIQWYIDHESWWKRVMSGEYQEYYQKQYVHR